jgi:hypothetical protein
MIFLSLVGNPKVGFAHLGTQESMIYYTGINILLRRNPLIGGWPWFLRQEWQNKKEEMGNKSD